MAPLGGGQVLLTCPARQKLLPVQFTEAGKVRRIRGVAYPFKQPSLDAWELVLVNGLVNVVSWLVSSTLASSSSDIL